MKMKPILTVVVIVTAVFLAACATPAQPGSKAWVEVSCDEFYNDHHINTMLEV